MSPLGKAKPSSDGKKSGLNVGPYILPLYILLSAVFIAYVAYGYFSGQVYRSGFLTGREEGITITINELVQKVGSQCEPVGINYGNQVINVINIACLQAPAPNEASEEVGEGNQ